jgi:hypothetical protein
MQRFRRERLALFLSRLCGESPLKKAMFSSYSHFFLRKYTCIPMPTAAISSSTAG